MDKRSEPEKKIESKQIISQERAKALDIAFMTTRLLDEKHFEIASDALKTKDEELFLKTCASAGIPPKIAKAIWIRLSGEKMLPGGPW